MTASARQWTCFKWCLCIALRYIDMKRNCISDDFTFWFWNAKDCTCNSSPVNNCTPNYAWVHLGNTGMITHIVITFFISLAILKNRTYLSRPSLGIFKRDVHSLILLSLRQIRPWMSALECQCCSGWAVSWNLVVTFLVHMVSSWDSCWGCSCSAIIDCHLTQGQPTANCL